MIQRALQNFLFLLLLICLAPVLVSAQDAYLQDLGIGRYVRTNVDHPIKVTVRNSVDSPISAFRIGWRWKGGPVNISGTQRVLGGGIVSNTSMDHTHPVQLNIPQQGKGILKVWVDAEGDRDRRNDTITFMLRAIDRGVTRTTLLEMKTSAGCSYCPKANALCNYLDRDPKIAVAKFHYDDPLNSPSITSYFDQYTTESFTPAGVIDQGDLGSYIANTQHSQWTAQIAARATGVSPVSLKIVPHFDRGSRVLTVEMTSTFTYAESGNYTMNAFVLEDNVRIPGESADKSHDQTVRYVLGRAGGTPSVIPETVVAGTPYTHTYSYWVPKGHDPNKIRIVGYVSRCDEGLNMTLNAAKTGYITASQTRQ